jgi:hypothetical protein
MARSKSGHVVIALVARNEPQEAAASMPRLVASFMP